MTIFLPLNPGNERLLVKKNDIWEVGKEIKAMPNGIGVDVYGDQLYNDQNYFRVLLSFQFDSNLDSLEGGPVYTINYSHYDNTIFSIGIFVT